MVTEVFGFSYKQSKFAQGGVRLHGTMIPGIRVVVLRLEAQCHLSSVMDLFCKLAGRTNWV